MRKNHELTEDQVSILTEWVRSLREDNIEQAHGVLCNGKGYCCLGVLSEQAVKAGIINAGKYGKERKIPTPKEKIYRSKNGGFSSTLLTGDVARWAGLERNPKVGIAGQVSYTSLSQLNDSGMTFIKIAEEIEKEYLL